MGNIKGRAAALPLLYPDCIFLPPYTAWFKIIMSV